VSQLNSPGALRRFWWRSTPAGRLSVACLSVVLSMTATGFALSNTTLPTPEEVAQATPGATPRPGDPVITVHSVSAVDLFNGHDVTTGALVRVHVPGIRSTAPCWTGDAVAFARKTLEGKRVWLLNHTSGAHDPEGRLLADVMVPTGQTYTQVVVAAGAGLAAPGSDEQLRSAEDEARQNHRGVWATSCVPSTPSTSESSRPPSTTGTPGTTTDTGTTTMRPTTPVVIPPQPTVTTSPQPQPPDDVQHGVEIGAPCSPEGAHGATTKGQDVRCKRKGDDLRWLRE
jgi:hypothetical protein